MVTFFCRLKYFTPSLRKEVLKEKDNIDDGIGIPGKICCSPCFLIKETSLRHSYLIDWKLVLCLLASWGCVLIILIKGVRSSGKASYFLALFPYVGMGILLVRACTLEGNCTLEKCTRGKPIPIYFRFNFEVVFLSEVW